MTTQSRSGSSIILVAVTDLGQFIVSLAKGFNPGQSFRYTFEQFIGEYTWREAVLHAISANFTINENTRFDRMLVDRGITPDARNPLGINPEHVYRVLRTDTFQDVMILDSAVVENEGITLPSADTIVTNISGTAKRIIPLNEIQGQQTIG